LPSAVATAAAAAEKCVKLHSHQATCCRAAQRKAVRHVALFSPQYALLMPQYEEPMEHHPWCRWSNLHVM